MRKNTYYALLAGVIAVMILAVGYAMTTGNPLIPAILIMAGYDGAQPFHIRESVVLRGRGQVKVLLPDRRKDLQLAASAVRQDDLAALEKGSRGDFNNRITLHARLAGQAPALPDAGIAQDFGAGLRGRAAPARHAHPALAAGPAPAAGSLENISGPCRDLQENGSGQNIDAAAGRLEHHLEFLALH